MEKDQDENRKYQAPTEKSMLDVVFGKTLKDITKDLPEDDPIRVMAEIGAKAFNDQRLRKGYGGDVDEYDPVADVPVDKRVDELGSRLLKTNINMLKLVNTIDKFVGHNGRLTFYHERLQERVEKLERRIQALEREHTRLGG